MIADSAETSTLLDVVGRPAIAADDSTTADVVLDARETLTLRFRTRANPTPDVLVFHNGESLFADIRTASEASENVIVVTRKSMRKGDSGQYMVRLSNEHGETERAFNVRVNGEWRRRLAAARCL